MTWTDAFALDELAPGSARLLKRDDYRVAVFRLDDGEIFAVDNACPHEGYPLVQGETRGRVLTCAWHNYKFSLETGSCLKGDEDVRSYPSRVVGGRVEIDLAPEDPARVIASARRSLEEGMLEGQSGRMARDVVRLLRAGVPARELLADVAALDARHAEYGTTHATPVAVDLLELLDGGIEHDALVVMQALELASEANVRRPARTWPAAVASSHLAEDLSAAVEAEDVERALGLVRGADSPAVLGQAVLRCASEHFLGFGHPLIYTTKVLELLERDVRHATDLFTALVLRIVSSTREDTLPPMKRWREWVDGHRLRAGTHELELAAVEDLAARILDPADRAVEEEFLAHVVGDTATSSLIDALVLAAAGRLLRFDPAIHDDWTVQDDWLSVTHMLTYAHAIREATVRTDAPGVLKNLVWSLAFVRRGHRLDLADPPAIPSVPATAEDIVAALEHHDPRVAALAAGYCDGGGDAAELGRALHPWLLGARATRPILMAHQVKTLRVALQEMRLRTPLVATLRYLAHPVAEQDLRAEVHDAVQLVVHGNLPKRRAQ